MKKKNNNIDNIFESSSNVMLDSKKLSRPIENSVTLITKSIKNGNKISKMNFGLHYHKHL